MVRVRFDPRSIRLINETFQCGAGGEDYYVGRVFQRGRGLGGYYNRHYGAGVGDVFKSIWRFLKPIAIGTAKSVGQQGLESGAKILENLAQGADLKETLRSEGKEGVRKLLESAGRKLQRGSGIKRNIKGRRGRPLHTQVILKPEELIGKKVSKIRALKTRERKRFDSLGLY